MLYTERQSPVEVTAQYFAAETRHAKDQVDRQIRKPAACARRTASTACIPV